MLIMEFDHGHVQHEALSLGKGNESRNSRDNFFKKREQQSLLFVVMYYFGLHTDKTTN